MRIPFDVTFHPSWWHRNAGVNFTQDFFDDPQTRIEADMAMRRVLFERFGRFGLGEAAPAPRPLLGTDYLAAGYLHSEILGCGIRYAANDSPQVLCAHLDPDALSAFSAPKLDESAVWQRTRRQIDWLLGVYGRVEVYVNLMGVQNVALDLVGQDFFYACADDPDGARWLLSEITRLSIEIGKRFRALSRDISGGVTAVVRQSRPDCYLTSNCSVEMVSLKHYEDFLLDCDTALARAFNPFGIHHCGRSMEHVIAGYARVPNLVFAEVGAGSDLLRVRAALPDVFLNARYAPAALLTQSPEDIARTVDTLFAQGAGKGGALFSLSCVGIDENAADDSVLAFLSACAALASR